MLTRIAQRLDQFFIDDLAEYLRKAIEGARVIWAVLLSAGNYLLFPDRALMVSLCCVLGAATMDVITRCLATRCRQIKWTSEQFWEGTGVKLVAYLVIAFLAGLSFRLAPFMQQPTVFLWTAAYAVMFLREVQSNMENLSEMGADVGWLLAWVRKKEKQIMETDEPHSDQATATEQVQKPKSPASQ